MSNLTDQTNPTSGSSVPPPLPPQPPAPTLPYQTPGPAPATGFDQYHHVAETVGLVPSLRKKDNLYQGIAVLAGTILGAGVGLLISSDLPVILVGALAGLVAAGLLSGFVLMILGFTRLGKK